MSNTHRRLTALTISILLTLVSTSIYLAPIVRADEKLGELRVIFSNRRYAEVLTRLYNYREQPYGKTAEVDYMIASCLCRTGSVDKAKTRFDWILKRYRLAGTQRKVVEDGLRQCSGAGQSAPGSFREPTMTSRATEREVGVRGKGGTITAANPSDSIANIAGTIVPVTSESAELIRDIAPEEFESRLFDRSQKADAIQSVKKLAGPTFKVESIGPFIVADNRQLRSEQALTVAQVLERYASFYETQFGLSRPDKFITIYLVASAWEMQKLASRLHGIRVSESSIGYSFPFDLSMVGIVSGTEAGTLAHELFHLMVRSDFGDIPPWLEEGMASLYEVSQERGNYIAGISNWRGRILAEFWAERPSVEQLVKMDWRSFDGTEGERDFRRQAINHAAARYFMLYLQEKGKLVDVYKSFRAHNVDDVKADAAGEDARLLASVMHKSLSAVDQDFDKWFSSMRANEATLRPPQREVNPANAPARRTEAGNAPTGNAVPVSAEGVPTSANAVPGDNSGRRSPDPKNPARQAPPPSPPPTPRKGKP